MNIYKKKFNRSFSVAIAARKSGGIVWENTWYLSAPGMRT